MRAVLILAGIGCLLFPRVGGAQNCPSWRSAGSSIESVSRTLTGQLAYHLEYRHWIGLRLDAPVCGVSEVQLVDLDRAGESKDVEHLETFRGCRVKTTAVLDVPGTTCFSAEVFQVVDRIEPVAECRRSPAFPDYSTVRPSRSVRRYRVLMQLNYKNNTPVRVLVESNTRRLTPVQVYAPYRINGSFSIEAQCGDGFAISRVRGTEEGHPSETDGTVWIDPESAAVKNVWRIRLSYTCSR